MTTKYITAGALMAVFLVAGSVQAATGTSNTAERQAMRAQKVEFRKSGNVDVACIGTAVATRETALGSAVSSMNTSVENAYSARASALAAAYAQTDTAEVRTDVRAAWDAFKKDVRAARSAWKAAQKSAWNTYRDSTKSCKSAKDLGDAKSMSQEVSI